MNMNIRHTQPPSSPFPITPQYRTPEVLNNDLDDDDDDLRLFYITTYIIIS